MTQLQAVADIKGNASAEQKANAVNLRNAIGTFDEGFAATIMGRVVIVSVDYNVDSGVNKKEAVVVSEILVTEDMCNPWRVIHGGCTATLIDFATSIPVPVLRPEDEWSHSGLTLNLAITYFLPAPVGETLRMVCTTKSAGKRAVTVYGEIWGSKGLVACGTHTKMIPTILPK